MATPRYGDIVEMNGELFEFTPIGYMPVNPTRDISNKTIIKISPDVKPSSESGMFSGFDDDIDVDVPGEITDPDAISDILNQYYGNDPTGQGQLDDEYFDSLPQELQWLIEDQETFGSLVDGFLNGTVTYEQLQNFELSDYGDAGTRFVDTYNQVMAEIRSQLRTDEEGRYIIPDTLEQLMQGIGQAEIESIWADPSIIEILTANGIRMNPDAPYDISAAEGVTPEGFSQLLEAIQAIQDAGGYEEWLAQQEGGDNQEPTLLEQILADNPDITEEDVNVINSIIQATGRTIPTSIQDAKDLIENIWNSVSATSQDCETWTGRVVEGEGGSGSVPGSGSGTYQGWKDCVNIGDIFAIPGLNLPIPPGMVDITWKDLEDKIAEAGESLEDFLEDPTGWFEGKVNSAIEAVRDAWGDLTTGAIFTTDDLENVLGDLLGGWIAGIVIEEAQDQLEEINPFLFAGNCEDPAFREANEKYCAQAPLECTNGALNYPECNQCPEGFFFSEQTNQCEPEKQAPIGPTAEECAQQNRSHIPAEEGGTDRCGGCLSGYEPNTEGECVEESIEGPCKIPGQVRNEVTGECEDPVVFEPGAPCKNDLGIDGTYDEEGNCVIQLEPEPQPEPEPAPEPEIEPQPEPEPEPEPEIEPEPEPEPAPEPGPEPGPEPEPGEGEESCANGAVDWPLCSECADDTKPSDYEDGQCPGPVTGDSGDPGDPPVDGGAVGGGGGGGGRVPITGLSYQLPALQQIIAPPPVDYAKGLMAQTMQTTDYNQALGGVIANSLQKRKKGMLV